MEITVKTMETDDEIRGKAYVHWRCWHEAYTEIVSEAYLEKLTLSKCEQIAFQWRGNILIAKDGERVAGFAGYGSSGESSEAGELFALYVLPEYWGTGVAKQLFDAVSEQLSRFRTVGLWVLKENARAIRFYEKCGFLATGEEQYLPSIGAIEVRMKRPNPKTYAFTAILHEEPDGGAYVAFPRDIKQTFGKRRVKVHATFDGVPYDGSIVNMGVKNADGSVCFIIGVPKSVRRQIGKRHGDPIRVEIKER